MTPWEDPKYRKIPPRRELGIVLLQLMAESGEHTKRTGERPARPRFCARCCKVAKSAPYARIDPVTTTTLPMGDGEPLMADLGTCADCEALEREGRRARKESRERQADARMPRGLGG